MDRFERWLAVSAQEVARLTLRRIRMHPSTYSRGAWLMDADGLAIQEAHRQEQIMWQPIEAWKDAGVKACVAGHAVAVGLALYPGWRPGTKLTWNLTTSGEKVESWDFRSAGKELLELTDREAERLFTPERWKKEVERQLRHLAHGRRPGAW